MTLLIYELSKLFKSKILLILLAVLLAVNVWLLLGEIPADKVAKEKQLSDFMEIYKADPEGMDKYIEEFNAAYSAAAASRRPTSVGGTGGEQLPYPDNVYTENDYQFFRSDFSAIRKLTDTYKKALKNARRVANGHLTEYEYMGYDESMFEWQYQLKLLASYDELDKLEFPAENVVGYDVFFSYSGFCVPMLAALLLCGIMLVIPEKSGGMLLILRASKNGRAKTYLSKIAAGLVMSAILCVLFTISSLLAVYFKIGLYGAGLPLQMVDSMMFSPFFLSIGQGVALITLARLFSGFAFLSVIIVIACLFNDYIAPFAAGAVFIGLNYAIGTYNFLNEYSVTRNVNFFWSIDGTKYISVWSGVKLFGACAELLPTLIVLYSLVIIACGAGGTMLFSRGAIGQKKLKLPFKLDFIKKIRLPRIPFGTTTARYELKKLLTPVTAVIIVALVIATAYFANGAFNVKRDYAQNLYTEYMTELEGEWTEEKHEYLSNLAAEINSIVSKRQMMEDKYRSGEITYLEYGEYLNEYLVAQNKQVVVNEILAHSNYLKGLHDEGKKVAFFDDTGWKFLKRVNLSYLLCAAVILLFADVFSYEYRSGFYQIQRSEKNGRVKVLLIKLGIVAAVAAILGMIFEATQFIYAAHFSGLPGGAYTAISIEGTNVGGSITVGWHFFLEATRNVIYYVLLALGVAGISRGTKNIFPSLVIPTAVMFAPTVLSYFGVKVFDKLSLLNLFVR